MPSIVSVNNFQTLRQLSPALIDCVVVLGDQSKGDGGGGIYYFNPDADYPDNNSNCIRSIINGSGCWLSILSYSPSSGGGLPEPHASTHEFGGSDELNLSGLTGILADAQIPAGHASTHQAGGDDSIKLDDLAAPNDNTDLNATVSAHGLLPKLGGGTTNFLRADGSWSAPQASLGATLIEKDLGSVPVFRGSFTITDAAISDSSKVLVWQAPGPYTGKGTLADEAELQPVQIVMVQTLNGSCVVKWQTPPMVSTDRISGNGRLNISTQNNQSWPDIFNPKRLGKIRGNVKFLYLILA